MKVRSKQLYQYLLESGVLEGTPEAIGMAKLAYRKAYKTAWKQRKRPRKEVRFELTLKQFQSLQLKARSCDLRHTTYARQIVLATVDQLPFIPYRDSIRKVLQLVSMAATISIKEGVMMKELTALLLQAEAEILNYLQHAP